MKTYIAIFEGNDITFFASKVILAKDFASAVTGANRWLEAFKSQTFGQVELTAVALEDSIDNMSDVYTYSHS